VLIENEATNLITFSEEFDNAAWAKIRSTVSADAVVAPDGTTTADKLVEDGTADSTHYARFRVAHATFTDNANVTFSVYLKLSERTWAVVAISTKAGTFKRAYFNLATGAVGNETVDSYGSKESEDGFRRYWITMDIGSGATDPLFDVFLASGDNGVTYSGDGTSDIYLWGAQVEESPVPTSYIATSGAAVTRATESGEIAMTLPPGLFDSEGTAIVYWMPSYGYGYQTAWAPSGIVALRDNAISLLRNVNGAGAGRIYANDSTVDTYSSVNYAADTWYKLCVKWGYLVGGVKKFRVGVDSGSGVSWGTEQTFDGSYTLGTYLRLGYGLFGPMHMRQLSLFPTVLTDAEINEWTGTP